MPVLPAVLQTVQQCSWGPERAALPRGAGFAPAAAAWGPFQPKNPHEELLVPFSNPHRKSYQAGAERTFLVLSPLEHWGKGSVVTCLS